MIPVTYELAMKSIKQLRDSGQSVHVAIPIDCEDDPRDWVDWAAARLRLNDVGAVVSAEPQTLWTYRTRGIPAGMVGVLGQIVRRPTNCPPAGVLMAVEAVVARIEPPEVLRRDADKLRWPAKAYRGDVLICGGEV